MFSDSPIVAPKKDEEPKAGDIKRWFNGEVFDFQIPEAVDLRETFTISDRYRYYGTINDLNSVTIASNVRKFMDDGDKEPDDRQILFGVLSVVMTIYAQMTTQTQAMHPGELHKINQPYYTYDKAKTKSDLDYIGFNPSVIRDQIFTLFSSKVTLYMAASNCLAVSTVNLFRHRHHFQREHHEITKKLADAIGLSEFFNTQGCRLNADDCLNIFRNAQHHINLRAKWFIATVHNKNSAVTRRLTGYGSGYAKMSVVTAINSICKADKKQGFILTMMPAGFQKICRAIGNIEIKKPNPRYCENSNSFCGFAPAQNLSEILERDFNDLVVAFSRHIGSTLARQKTFRPQNDNAVRDHEGRLAVFSDAWSRRDYNLTRFIKVKQVDVSETDIKSAERMIDQARDERENDDLYDEDYEVPDIRVEVNPDESADEDESQPRFLNPESTFSEGDNMVD